MLSRTLRELPNNSRRRRDRRVASLSASCPSDASAMLLTDNQPDTGVSMVVNEPATAMRGPVSMLELCTMAKAVPCPTYIQVTVPSIMVVPLPLGPPEPAEVPGAAQ